MSERLTREQVEEWRERAFPWSGPLAYQITVLSSEVLGLMDERDKTLVGLERSVEVLAKYKARVQVLEDELEAMGVRDSEAWEAIAVLEERNRALSEALGGLFAWVSDFLNLGTEYEGTLYEGDLPMEDEVPQIRWVREALNAQALGVTREEQG